ncbi:MAG: outer membrane protein assembly factor BamE, partial [Inquilinaceae bacterium]
MTMTACAPQIATRGNLVEDERLAALEVGFTTEDEVATLLGTPTTISTFEPDVWYYIGQRTRQRAFFEPEIIERRVLMIDFD